MPDLFHARRGLSTAVLVAVGLLAAAPAGAGSPPQPAPAYTGRWNVAEAKPIFTARGRLYKTIDITACGHDLCGVSVGDRGACGVVLFRLPGRQANPDYLAGRGKWGEAAKNLQIDWDPDATAGEGQVLELYLGNGHDFGGRSDNMPKFHADYHRQGKPRCMVR